MAKIRCVGGRLLAESFWGSVPLQPRPAKPFNPRNKELYKTALCNYWVSGVPCRFGERCWSALCHIFGLCWWRMNGYKTFRFSPSFSCCRIPFLARHFRLEFEWHFKSLFAFMRMPLACRFCIRFSFFMVCLPFMFSAELVSLVFLPAVIGLETFFFTIPLTDNFICRIRFHFFPSWSGVIIRS